MDQLQHFNHVHPLMFKEGKQKNQDGAAVVCSACGNPVLGPSYSCNQCSKLFILHKSCAELPREMHHPIHDKHPLVLLSDRYYRCDICGKSHFGLFSYKCKPCDFDLDLQCASDLSKIKYLEHFSHEHALIFVEDPKKREGGLPVVCKGCGEHVLGPGYCCSRFLCHYILHKSCAELPSEMHHPIHRKHPLILLSGRYYRCDICRKSQFGLFSYKCKPCDFDIDLQCASDLSNIKYLEHFSHEHALIFVEDPRKREGSLPIVCQGCLEEVLGPSYCCSRFLCHYTLHKSCAEMPVEFRHPRHIQHPLILNRDTAKQYLCDACNQDCSGKFTYSCFQCHFNLDPQCTFNLTDFKHFSHVHPLMFKEGEQKNEDCATAATGPPVVCSACGDPVLGPSYSCNQCSKLFILHKSCAELPHEMHHPIHGKHPLVLLPNSYYSCDICRKSHSGLFSYNCKPCDFDIDLHCASNLSNIKCLEHFSHEHELIFMEEPKRNGKDSLVVCDGCREQVFGPSYCCSHYHCYYTLHKSCTELPQEFCHPMHTQHPLILNKDRGRNYQCDACNQDCSGKFTYSCFQCDFNLDQNCAFNWTGFKHFSHDHPLLFEKEPKKEYIGLLLCDGCQDPILGPSYTCINTFRRRKCGFNLHQKCAQLPHEIEHPMHRQHPLFLLSIIQDIRVRCLCNACKQLCKFRYNCSICDFNLHLKCASDWQNIIASDSHEHQFTILRKEMSDLQVNCDVCGEYWTGTVYYMCSICQLLVHKECASLPRNIKIRGHQHHLKLTWFLEDIYPNHLSCKVCSISIDKCRAVYCCSECSSYVAHVACTTGEYSREESFLDIALNDDESVDAPEIKHFSHQHLLAANDPCEVVNEGCIRPITAIKDSFYSCTKQEDELCTFFLHKICAQLPKKMLLPLLHQHQFTLVARAPSIGGVFQCYMCGTFNQGFTYTCEECALPTGETVFYLDIQCSTYWENKALKHESHVHRLLLNTEWEDVYCNSCGCDIFFCFSCKRCEFHLCIPCVRLPLTAMHRYDDHPLKLTYASVEDELGYYCEICEGKRDPTHWFYRCNDCDFDCHTHCILGRYQQVKLGSTYKHDAHGQHLVTLVDTSKSPIPFDKRENILPCQKCGKPCEGLVFECEECNINIHREGCCQVTDLESSVKSPKKTSGK